MKKILKKLVSIIMKSGIESVVFYKRYGKVCVDMESYDVYLEIDTLKRRLEALERSNGVLIQQLQSAKRTVNQIEEEDGKYINRKNSLKESFLSLKNKVNSYA